MLENGTCSMYSSRPVLCREFLATSPPELCTPKYREQTELVRLPYYVHNAMHRWETVLEGRASTKLVIMAAMLNWYENQQARTPRTWRGPEMVEHFLTCLAASAKDRPAGGSSMEPVSSASDGG